MLLYTTIQHEIRKEYNLSCNEYVLLDMIYHLSTNPDSKIKGWCYASKELLATEIGLSRQAINNMINNLEEKELVEKDFQTRFLKTTNKWNLIYFNYKESLQGVKKVYNECKESLPEECKESLHNNNNFNNNNIKVKEKQKEFAERIKPFIEDYGRDLCLEFYNYWSEANEKTGKLRWEKQDTFEIKKRLITWRSRHK
jgi:hypothetical protein